MKADMSLLYSDPTKMSKMSYVYNEDETIMMFTDENNDVPYTFDVPVKASYPYYSIADNIIIDIYIYILAMK